MIVTLIIFFHTNTGLDLDQLIHCTYHEKLHEYLLTTNFIMSVIRGKTYLSKHFELRTTAVKTASLPKKLHDLFKSLLSTFFPSFQIRAVMMMTISKRYLRKTAIISVQAFINREVMTYHPLLKGANHPSQQVPIPSMMMKVTTFPLFRRIVSQIMVQCLANGTIGACHL